MAGRLEGKVAIVTGAGSRGPGVGTGKAISVLSAREGAAVCLVDLHAERAAETLALVEAEGGSGVVVEADVASEGDCRRILAEAVARFRRLDVLVNNVGVDGGGPIHELDVDEWQRV